MKYLKENFLKTYANIPVNLRDDIILVLDSKGSITWNVAYFEVENNTDLKNIVLKNLSELKLI